jgi:hypothetical protein
MYHYIVAVNAAAGGHQDILQWMWDRHPGLICEESSAAAAANGNFELLRWMRERDLPWDVRTRQS